MTDVKEQCSCGLDLDAAGCRHCDRPCVTPFCRRCRAIKLPPLDPQGGGAACG